MIKKDIEKENMKNTQGTTEDLELFDKNGKARYKYYKDSNDYSCEYTYDENGNELTYKNSNGYSCEYTYDENGNELTYKNSRGVTRGFDTPEYTMEELEKIVGKKIKIKS